MGVARTWDAGGLFQRLLMPGMNGMVPLGMASPRGLSAVGLGIGGRLRAA
jgi:hypothetical protein